MGLKWLVTGGCGFIGRNLIKSLLAQGNSHYIRIIDNLSSGTAADLKKVCDFTFVEASNLSFSSEGVELVVGDILDASLALDVIQDIDIVVHLAANTGVEQSVVNPLKDCEINVVGTLNYLEAARKENVNKFVFASSGAPAGECEPPIHEELPPHPVSPYGASKLAGEGYCSAYFKTYGVETIVLRFGNVYGPFSNTKDSVVAKFIRKAMHGDSVNIYGDGTQTRDFIYVDDLVQAILLSVDKKKIGGQTFQIATSKETSVFEMVNILMEVLSKNKIQAVPIMNKKPRLGDVHRNYSDTSKANAMLGWYPKIDLYEGLGRTIEWYKNVSYHGK